MPTEQIGHRRLYDSIGCSLADRDELWFSFQTQDCYIDVYIGPKPRFGITVVKADKYIIPGEPSLMAQMDYKLDATESSYPRHFFTEITCWKEVQVSDEISRAFLEQKAEGHNALLKLVESDSEFFKSRIDLYCGLLGLRFHPQFIEELVNENCVAIRKDANSAFSFAGPGVKRLEAVKLNPNGIIHLSYLFGSVGQAQAEARKLACLAFQWLIRGWHEDDSISKFMALFTAIEVILEGFNPPADPEDARRASRITDHIETLPQDEAKDLKQFFQRLVSNRRPSLSSRFEMLAKEAAMQGAEADIAAFKHFNSVRNKLLHRGEQRVELIFNLSETEIRQLEDLSERYVNWVFFRDENVYKSMFRQPHIDKHSQ